MKKPGRNDPCPCGSGKKYKNCCLRREETPVASDRSEAVPRALLWLTTIYGQAVREALDGFFGGLDDEEYGRLRNLDPESYQGIMANAMEWLVADGTLTVKGQERRVSELILGRGGRGGALLSAEQRQWIELITASPLRLYEVVDVVAGESMLLKDVLAPERSPVSVREKSGSRQLVRHDLIVGRILPVGDHFELAGAVYSIPRQRSFDLVAQLREELEGLDPDSPEAREVTSVIIPDYWVKLFVTPFQMPLVVDHATGEPLLFITDHYRVQDWASLDQALSGEADIEGSREDGWSRIFEGEDGVVRRSLSIDPGKRPDRIKVSYRTQKYADDGRPWFEQVAGQAVAFLSREISDPKGALAHLRLGEAPEPSAPVDLPPEVLTELIKNRIRELYTDWADKPLAVLDNRTPREAIKTPEGLEQVKFLLHTYEHGEAKQAEAQSRNPVSYDFLWRELGITP